MLNEQLTTDSDPLTVPAAPGRYAGTGAAVLASAAVHGALLLVLSFVVLSRIVNTTPVVTVLFDRTGDGKEAKFEELAELRPQPLETSTVKAAGTDVSTILPETQPNLAATFLPNAGIAEDAASMPQPGASGLRQADPTVVSAIQDRVSKAGGRKGEVQFALAWKNDNDVDLHVIAPSGERICHNHRDSRCEGELDVDMNVRGESFEPVENIRWLRRKAPSGRYTVIINLFNVNSSRARQGHTEYQLLASLGKESEIVEDAVSASQSVVVHRFRYVPSIYSDKRRSLMLDQMDRQQVQEEERAQILLARALELDKGDARDERLREITSRYPHTDAAIEALKLMSNRATKS